MLSWLRHYRLLSRRSSSLVDFYATTFIDEIWVRSAVLEAVRAGLAPRLIVSGDPANWPVDFASRYASTGVRLISAQTVEALHTLQCRIIISASSGIPRSYFGETLRRLIHMPHSLASLHAIYPRDAFDGFDTLFAAGPHHVAEFHELGRTNGLGERKVYEIGYGKMDVLRDERPNFNAVLSVPHILIAPSWGAYNLIKMLGRDLIGKLLAGGYFVTLRPHPSFFFDAVNELDGLVAVYSGQERFVLEHSIGGSESLWTADLMVSDYSGMAMEFAALRHRPVVFADLPRKTLNPDWSILGIEPAEIGLRGSMGVVCVPEVDAMVDGIESMLGLSRNSVDMATATSSYLFEVPRVATKAVEAAQCIVREGQ